MPVIAHNGATAATIEAFGVGNMKYVAALLGSLVFGLLVAAGYYGMCEMFRTPATDNFALMTGAVAFVVGMIAAMIELHISGN